MLVCQFVCAEAGAAVRLACPAVCSEAGAGSPLYRPARPAAMLVHRTVFTETVAQASHAQYWPVIRAL